MMSNPELSSPHERFDARLQRRSAAALKARVLQSESEALSQAVASFAADAAVERAAALIVRARRRFVFGAAKSFSYASLLANDLKASLTNVYLVDGTVTATIDVLSDVRSTDVLVVFSLRRYRSNVVEMAKSYAERGGTLVVVTDSLEAPLAKVAKEVVIVRTDSASYTDSSLAVVLAIHLLSTLTTASAKGAGRQLLEKDRLSAELNLYIGD